MTQPESSIHKKNHLRGCTVSYDGKNHAVNCLWHSKNVSFQTYLANLSDVILVRKYLFPLTNLIPFSMFPIPDTLETSYVIDLQFNVIYFISVINCKWENCVKHVKYLPLEIVMLSNLVDEFGIFLIVGIFSSQLQLFRNYTYGGIIFRFKMAFDVYVDDML